MQIQDLMTPHAVTCHADAPLHEAEARVVAMITDRDICMAAYTQGRPLHSLHVRDAMAREVLTCRATDESVTVLKEMTSRCVRRVPVVDADRRPVGMLSISDLIRNAVASGSTKRDAAVMGIAQSMVAICAPRKSAPSPLPAPVEPPRAKSKPQARA